MPHSIEPQLCWKKWRVVPKLRDGRLRLQYTAVVQRQHKVVGRGFVGATEASVDIHRPLFVGDPVGRFVHLSEIRDVGTEYVVSFMVINIIGCEKCTDTESP